MSQDDLLKFIKTSDFWIAEGPAVLQSCFPWMEGFLRTSKYWSFGFKRIIAVYKNDYVVQYINREDNIKVSQKLLQLYRTNKFKSLYSLWGKHRKLALENWSHLDSLDLQKLSNIELVKEYLNFYELFIQQWSIPLILEGLGLYIERYILPEFTRQTLQLKKAIRNEFLATLIQSDKISFIAQEYLDLLKICLKVKTVNNAFLLQHQHQYHWIRNNYLHFQALSPADFFQIIKKIRISQTAREINLEIKRLKNYCQIVKKQKQQALTRLRLSQKLKHDLEALSFFGAWQDERKRMCLRGDYHLGLFLQEIARRTKIDYYDLGYALPRELKEVLINKNFKLALKLKERRKMMVVDSIFGRGHQIIIGNQAKRIQLKLAKTKSVNKNLKELSGTVVSISGLKKVRGIVRVVLDPKKSEFKRGEILVTSMTRPEFVPLIKKAKAVITNEGGLTSHAAIVSREFKITCIVGTKIATQVLHDGDLVEVDAEKGFVKLLKL